MGIPDQLEREIVVRAPRARVWEAITDPQLLVQWFPTRSASVDLRTGGAMRFVWDQSADEAVIDAVEPPARLVFRWRPEGVDRPYTTVTFTLLDEGDTTRVRLTERGFAALPEGVDETAYEGNAAGWVEELQELQGFVEAA